MRLQIRLFAAIAVLTTAATPFAPNFPAPFHTTQALAQTPDARKAEADRLYQQGIEQFQTSQFEAALQSWQQALNLYREIKYRLGEGDALGNVGNAYDSLGDYAKAIDYHQQRLVIAREIKDRAGEGASLGNLGLAYRSLGDYAKAIGYHQQSLAIAREIKDRAGEGNALGNLGVAYDALGDYAKAIDYHQQSLAIDREIKDRFGEGASLANLGIAYASLGDYAKAIDYHQQHLVIAREIKDRLGEGASLGGLGVAYYFLGNYAKAIDYHQQTLAIAKGIKDRSAERASLGNLGLAYRSLGDYAKAIDYYQQSLVIAKGIKDRQGEGQSLGDLGTVYNNLGDYAKAIDYYQQRLAIAREIKDRAGEGNALGGLGSAYASLGDYAKAIDYHQQHLAIAREIKNRLGEGNSLSSLGSVYGSLGDYAKAIDYHQQSLAIALGMKDRAGEGQALGNLGLAYNSLGDYTKAIDYHQQSLAIALGIKNRFEEGRSLSNLGLAFRKSGNLAQAEKTLRAGIEVWESLRERLGGLDAEKVSIFEQQASAYRQLQQVLIAQNQPTIALEVSERGRARAFVELLATRFSSTSSAGPNVSTNPPNIQEIQQIAKQQNATLVEYSIIYDEFKIQGKQEPHESELYIWVIPPSGEVSFRRVDLKPLWQQQNTTLPQLVVNSREAIGIRGRGLGIIGSLDEVSQTGRLQQLHQLLIQPIADLLPADPNARVIFIPQKSLFLVPFAALQDANNKYLIEQHTLLTAPSIQVLALTRQQRQQVPVSAKDVLVVGNPTMPSLAPKIGDKPQPLSPLPGAEKEAMEIARLLNTTALTGNQATEAAVVQKLPTAKMVHLATHGLLDDFQGLGVPGAIALTPSGKDDGFLTASEILNLKLNAELVVLSACDTGRGKVTGDGVIGLSRSLITAGVPSVIVTLWAIPDNPSALLMTEFYRNLQQNSDKAQALRSAMLTTMKQYPDQPSAWAAYTLIGEAE
ncbi:tetratricopeptide repeat protein [Coleofasciculus sp. FACHB-501]|uniref:tetratricopeptide repeat protein n=1 Tax=Cyanophyceae TaxID=3028117 RepID=UPI0016841A55|nr:tetratricopeptide repeat protein [Coleofasciculus sp. FACHB-501]